MPTTVRPRIDSLTPGQKVQLRYHGYGSIEDAVFVGITGTGDDRQAMFVSVDSVRHTLYRWSAYRFQGRWVYGTSADRLSVYAVVE